MIEPTERDWCIIIGGDDVRNTKLRLSLRRLRRKRPLLLRRVIEVHTDEIYIFDSVLPPTSLMLDMKKPLDWEPSEPHVVREPGGRDGT